MTAPNPLDSQTQFQSASEPDSVTLHKYFDWGKELWSWLPSMLGFAFLIWFEAAGPAHSLLVSIGTLGLVGLTVALLLSVPVRKAVVRVIGGLVEGFLYTEGGM